MKKKISGLLCTAVLAELQPQPLEEELEQKNLILDNPSTNELLRAIRRHRPARITIRNYAGSPDIQTYADFYSLLLTELGIDNAYVRGYASEESKARGVTHTWVRLYIDGKEYDTDPTNDDVANRPRDRYFMIAPYMEEISVAPKR